MEDTRNQSGRARRRFLTASTAGLAAASLFGISSSLAKPAAAKSSELAILNAALDLEHQGIWAYGVAAGKLSSTPTGTRIKELAMRNQADHMKHRDLFISTIKSLGGTPVAARDSYDLSAYVKAGEGNLDNDANIAKLALALEVDAALAYASAVMKLKTPALVAAGLSILPDESAHAAAIRTVFHGIDSSIAEVPGAQLSAEYRGMWVLKV